MVSPSEWRISPARQPKPGDYGFDLDRALGSVVGIRAIVPDDAFTAETLGTERAGSGVLIDGGAVLTIGYLITEAEEIWLACGDGRVLPGHPLAYDQATGFGLVQPLGRLDLPPLALGKSGEARPGTPVVVAGSGGRRHAVAASIIAKQEFAGYWEYVLDEAIFTAPAHPLWGGAAVIGPGGDLLGIGSLQLEHKTKTGESGRTNMAVPIDVLKPILPDLLASGRTANPPRPWLGLFASEMEGNVVVVGVAGGAPADLAGLRAGDIVSGVSGAAVESLSGFFHRVWGLGAAGVDVPLTVVRDGRPLEALVASKDRSSFLKAPRMHS